MLESLKIEGFRKYEELNIGSFGLVNFILGDNNVGKTTILEAIYSWACGQHVIPFFAVPLARARYSGIQQPYWVMDELMALVNDRKKLPLTMNLSGVYNGENVGFSHTIYPSELLTDYDSSYKKDIDKMIPRSNDISEGQVNPLYIQGVPVFNVPTSIAKWEVKHNRTTQITNVTVPMREVPATKPFCSAKYVDVLSNTSVAENVQIYAVLKRERLLDQFVNEIRKVFPEIKGFDMIPYPDGSQAPISIVKKDDSILPMYAFGDGIQRWFYIIGALVLYNNSIICIDEIDTGLHKKAQKEFCYHLLKYAKRQNTQLFVTTHNIEFMDYFIEAADLLEYDEKSDIKVFTLREGIEKTDIRSMDITGVARARKEFNLELR